MMQIGMMATLLFAMPVNFSTELGLFTAIILAHNAFGATQDVAIDAMAVNVLPEHERGTANGFMFAGASIGQAIGGSGVLFLTALMPFTSTYIFVIGSILAVTVFVVLPLKEPPTPRPKSSKGALAAVGTEHQTVVMIDRHRQPQQPLQQAVHAGRPEQVVPAHHMSDALARIVDDD